MATCPNCGGDNPDGFRFCGSCGSALAERPSAHEERKVLTVLFADLVGFTARSEELDPEDVRAILTQYHQRLRTELERYGGTVEKFIGDAVMALFGAPIAHEDDPERAVRAAFAVRDAVAELAERQPERQLAVRVGITTGETVVDLAARPELGEGMAAGDVVNTAARLQSAAPVGGVLVDEATFRATDRAIVYRNHEPVTAKGKADPVPVWEAVEPRARLGVDVAREAQAPLVGRTQEIDLLGDALARVRRERSPQLVTLIGVPGIGKSRLVSELLRTVHDDPELITWRQGRSLPYGQGVSYWALGEMVKAQAGVLETDPDDEAERKLHEAVRSLVGESDEAAWVERQLRPLLGLDPAARDGSIDEAFAAWRRFLEALADDGPTVLVFEDLHWADDGLLDFVGHLAEWASGVPLLVLCTARPELLARRPGWGGGTANAATVSLAPLSSDETARLIAALSERAVMPAEVQAALLAGAGGNPLYAEEFVRMAAERGATDLERLPLPESIQGIIAARLDGLEPADKALLQDAAVIGKVFWLGAVAEVGGLPRWELERRLHGLERRQLVRRERRTSVAGEVEYAFWHVLVRDVAYGQIPRAARAEKHRQAAEWMLSLSQERAGDRADLLAHHYLAAVEFARASGQATARLEEPAREALRAAGRRALVLNAFPAAVRHYRGALALTLADDEARADVLFGLGRALLFAEEAGEAELRDALDLYLEHGDVEGAALAHVELGLAAWHRGAVSRTGEHVEEAAALLRDRPASEAKVHVLAAFSRYRMLAGRSDDAIAAGREALAMAERFGLDEIVAHTLNNIGTARVASGDPGGYADLERALEIGESLGSIEATRAYINLASVTQNDGDIRRGNELHRRGLELARRYGAVTAIRFLRAELIIDAGLLGDWDESVRDADAFLAEIDVGSPYYMEGAVRTIRALIRLGRGDVEGARADIRRALVQAEEIGEPQSMYPAFSAAALLSSELGELSEAARLVDRLTGEGAGGESLWLFPAAFAFDRLGRLEELAAIVGASTLPSRWLTAAREYAAGERAAAADLLEEVGAVSDAAYARLRAAEALAGDGRRAEADAQLRLALGFYRGVGATRFVRAGERLLAASA